jgi:cellulose synthase (UDP-forming)
MRLRNRGRWRSLPSQHPGSGSGGVPRSAPIIVDERVLRPGAPITRDYLILSAIASVAIALFGIRWVTLPAIGEHPVLYAAATGIVAYYIAVWTARWAALSRMRRPQPLSPQPDLRVAVATTFVPGVEPLAMLETTVRALVDMHHPHDTWVLDEGDDPEVRALCERLGARYFTRRNLPEFLAESGRYQRYTKHGNYNAWLTEAAKDSYDVVVAIDPDHVPRPEYLTTLLGYFRDPEVGYVQAPPVYFNQESSFIARGAAEETYAYHSSHQMASYALGHPIIVGSHSLHRVAALRQVGGFPAHHAEDLYLTMLYRAEGWRGVYLPRILALGVTPVDWPGYLSQQVRWGRAVVDLKLRAFRELAPRLSPLERILNLFHGVYFLRPLAFFVLFAMLIAMLLLDAVPSFLEGGPLLAGLGLLVVLHAVDRFRQRFFLDPKRERGFHWRAAMLQLAKWPHLTAALFDAAINRRVKYVVTRKTEASGGDRHVLALPHLGIVVLVLSAAAIGIWRHGALPPILVVLATLAIGSSLVLVWSERLKHGPPYDLALLKRRQSEVDALLGAAASAGVAQVERRLGNRRSTLTGVRPAGPERRFGERRTLPTPPSTPREQELITTDP